MFKERSFFSDNNPSELDICMAFVKPNGTTPIEDIIRASNLDRKTVLKQLIRLTKTREYRGSYVDTENDVFVAVRHDIQEHAMICPRCGASLYVEEGQPKRCDFCGTVVEWLPPSGNKQIIPPAQKEKNIPVGNRIDEMLKMMKWIAAVFADEKYEFYGGDIDAQGKTPYHFRIKNESGLNFKFFELSGTVESRLGASEYVVAATNQPWKNGETADLYFNSIIKKTEVYKFVLNAHNFRYEIL